MLNQNPLHEIAFLEKVQNPGHPNVVRLTAALEDGEFLAVLGVIEFPGIFIPPTKSFLFFVRANARK